MSTKLASHSLLKRLAVYENVNIQTSSKTKERRERDERLNLSDFTYQHACDNTKLATLARVYQS